MMTNDLSSKLFQNLATAWGLDRESIILLRKAQNFVYVAKQTNGQKVILRISPQQHRSLEQLQTEIAWLKFLREQNFPCSIPIAYDQQSYIYRYQLPDNNDFYCVCFEYISADFIDYNNDKLWNQQLFLQMGILLGKLHSATAKFAENYRVVRYFWYEEYVFSHLDDIKKQIPLNIYERIHSHINYLKTNYSTDPSMFGLIQNDYRLSNILYNKDTAKLYLIDFDGGCFHWLAKDFAHLIFATYIHPRLLLPNQTLNDVKVFCEGVLAGFQKFSQFSNEQLRMVPDLIRLSVMMAYLFDATIEDTGDLDSHQMSTATSKEILANIVLNDHPVIKLDFTQFNK